jgi:predicted ATP-grasp superfamily ATP-dependent carboligase
MDPRLLYTLRDDVLSKLDNAHPVLIHQLDGFVDAGQAGRIFSAHLLENLEHEVLAEFDHDQLHDYRSRRPAMIFDTNTWKSYADVSLRLYRVVDEQGEVFLLLTGPEPDVQWERLAAAVIELVEQIGVRLSVSIHGIPMAVPHTRPVTLTAHATDPDLVKGYRSWIDRVEVPASFSGLLEFRLGQRDRKAMGFAAHVPHYLAQAAYPAASLSLLEHLERLTGLHVPTETLREAAEANRTEIDEQIGRSAENIAVVAALEEQYDSFTSARESTGLLGAAGEVPSGEEIGAQIEQFLAEQDRKRPGD